MHRVLILGRGGAGKSTAAKRLSKLKSLPYIELDKHFWKHDLSPTPRDEWIKIQKQLAVQKAWVMDGDLGTYDELQARLRYADTIILLDFSLITCALRAFKRSRERLDFWMWLVLWPLKSRSKILRDIQTYAPNASLHIFTTPKQLEAFLKSLSRQYILTLYRIARYTSRDNFF